MTEPFKSVDKSLSRLLRLRVWLWKLRYGMRIFVRSCAPDASFGHHLGMCLGHIADTGWGYAVESEGSVAEALKISPTVWADEELSCWTE